MVQEVFQATSQHIGQFHRDRAGETFRGWLRGITRHKALSFWRGRENVPESIGGSEAYRRLQEVPEAILPPDSEEEAQMSTLYHRAVQLLWSEFEERTWSAFWRTAVDGQSAADVAAELDTTANAVRMAKSRVLRRLREELGDLVE
jgi:RNA polymerase sigma-70 factor (ECF subfamily)